MAPLESCLTSIDQRYNDQAPYANLPPNGPHSSLTADPLEVRRLPLMAIECYNDK
jgi:hypothetical protein